MPDWIKLVGPAAVGKTTIGSALSQRLALRFVDLDSEFTARYGDISAYLDAHCYAVYAEQNVGLYLDLNESRGRPDVIALSSGFMTYPDDIHPDYLACRRRIASSPLTFVLLPSLDAEVCVAEVLRRQLRRPFARLAGREEQVIRERFPVYMALPARKVETLPPIDAIVEELVAALADTGGTPEGAPYVRTEREGMA